MKTLEQLNFCNNFAELPSVCYSPQSITALKKQYLISFNPAAAKLIELDPTEAKREDFVDLISGKQSLPNYKMLAMCYAGHQFGHYVPRLGDGRAVLLGQIKNSKGELWDLQIKGSGPTPYSRGSDGRAVLRSSIREYLCSEAMQGLGIPTTRALCLLGSDEEVYREQIEPGAMLLRMSPSHVRFGSFEYLYYNELFDELKQLADYVITQHFPHILKSECPYLDLLRQIIKDTAKLIAQWQAVGFCHGVMNSDNMSMLSLTMDYGPFGFMEAYQPHYICNHSDHQGRYAYDKQPEIALFNLTCLAQALLPLFDDEGEVAAVLAKKELAQYQMHYVHYYSQNMRAKLGLFSEEKEDQQLCADVLALLQQDAVDFTIFFRQLSEENLSSVRDLFLHREEFDLWMERYLHRYQSENMSDASRSQKMKQINPKYILRNYMAELAIRKAQDEKDYSEIERLLSILQAPFDEHPDDDEYAGLPPDWSQSLSVSCSS